MTIFIFYIRKVRIDSLSWRVWRAKCCNGASIKQFPVDLTASGLVWSPALAAMAATAAAARRERAAAVSEATTPSHD
ncbi:hypothetical protein [Janthinobacterium tructae]|uniref:hypothetical protein n=1 Tax=Janthinobacterium tructae TaxID=2590869 RepID=UPI00249B4D60|nr:hypothetical protein [Janthinobacterium tructae]MDI3293958.1 hypothetical protein [Janthinobacterium tructae]